MTKSDLLVSLLILLGFGLLVAYLIGQDSLEKDVGLSSLLCVSAGLYHLSSFSGKILVRGH